MAQPEGGTRTGGVLREVLRDRWITGCATLIVLSMLGAYVFLVATDHSEAADRAVWRAWQGLAFLLTLGGAGGRVIQVGRKIDVVNERVNGHLAELTAKIPDSSSGR